jgi:hypothetical protein
MTTLKTETNTEKGAAKANMQGSVIEASKENLSTTPWPSSVLISVLNDKWDIINLAALVAFILFFAFICSQVKP